MIMHVDLDAFFVSVEQALNPELKDKPVVVGGKPEGRGVVAAASYEARKFGLHSGMPLSTAVKLCPQAIFVTGNFARYRDASAKFMQILADFSPFLEPGGLDEAYLDVTGFESLHGSLNKMAISIKQRINQELGICASIGIASCKIVAKIASDQSKPDGLLEVISGNERSFLSPLSIAKMPGIGKKTEEKLLAIGIHTLGQLADMSINALTSQFGSYGEMLHRYANGIDNRKIALHGPVKSISRETTFARDIDNPSLLEGTLRYLSERVGGELRQSNRQAGCIFIKLRYADFTTITHRHTLGQTTCSDQTVFQTGLQLLEKALSRQIQPIRLIGVGVSNLSEGSQLNMLDISSQRQEKLNLTVDRIRKKYGFTAIQTGRTLLLKDIFDSN